jgi:uncharacterized membrane protein YcaP (DUF421 family)
MTSSRGCGSSHGCADWHSDLEAILRQHGHQTPADVRLAVFETRGVVSVFDEADRSG